MELTPPRPGQLGRYSAEDFIRLNSSEFKNLASDVQTNWNLVFSILVDVPADPDPQLQDPADPKALNFL